MATDFTQESVLAFLRCNGGRVRNSELLAHFRYFLREVDNCAQNRELFKTFINAVAVVKHEDGVSYVVLRKKFKVAIGDVGSNRIPTRAEGKRENPRTKRERSPKEEINRGRERRRVPAEASGNLPNPGVPRAEVSGTSKIILPAAGIATNNNNSVGVKNFEIPVRKSQTSTFKTSPQSVVLTECSYPNNHLKPLLTPPFSSESERSSGSGQSFEQAWDKGPMDTSELPHNSSDIENLGQSREPDGCCSTTYCPPSHSPHQDRKQVSREEFGQKVKQLHPHSVDRYSKADQMSWPLPCSLGQSSAIAISTPCITESFATPLSKFTHLISYSNDCLSTPKRESFNHVHNESMYAQTAVASSQLRRSLPLEPSHAAAGKDAPTLDLHHTPLSPTHDCLRGSGSGCEWPFALGQGTWSSEDSLSVRVPDGAQTSRVEEMLQHARQANLLSQLHRPERRNIPGYHRSTGYLGLESPSASDDGGTDPGLSPDNLLRPPTRRRISQRDRGRICRSLGAGLDQPFPEDNEVARHNRLLLLSSSLSLNHPVASTTPPRVPSSMDVSLSGASSTDSLSPGALDRAFVHRSPVVPLAPREHDWMVKAAAAEWSEIYSLFREDSGLLAKRDFITGYTVLHWIAQHGDHRVLNTLWYGVNKAGKTLEVDAKTNCGYTPLHLAAMYGHKKLARLLVHKFKADVRVRDTSGRRAWQYLDTDTPKDLLQLLGAPQKKCSEAASPLANTQKAPKRPSTISATVKRHASLAALFKHKSLGRISGHVEMAV